MCFIGGIAACLEPDFEDAACREVEIVAVRACSPAFADVVVGAAATGENGTEGAMLVELVVETDGVDEGVQPVPEAISKGISLPF